MHLTLLKNPFVLNNSIIHISDRVIAYANYLIKNVDDPNLREMLWLNTPEHLTGNHTLCIHPSMVHVIFLRK